MLINLLLAGPNAHLLVAINELGELHDLAEMELADRVKIVLNQIHLLDELRYELDQRVELVANFPAALPHDFMEQIAMVRDTEHRMREFSVAENGRLAERILVRHKDFKFVLFYVLLFQVRLDGTFVDSHMNGEAQNGVI